MAHLWVAVSLSVDFVCEVAELLIECDSSSTICPIEECGHNSSAQKHAVQSCSSSTGERVISPSGSPACVAPIGASKHFAN
jgi:hypothetical protein